MLSNLAKFIILQMTQTFYPSSSNERRIFVYPQTSAALS